MRQPSDRQPGEQGRRSRAGFPVPHGPIAFRANQIDDRIL